MITSIVTATLLWVATAAGGLPVSAGAEIAPAVENIYYVQIDGMT